MTANPGEDALPAQDLHNLPLLPRHHSDHVSFRSRHPAEQETNDTVDVHEEKKALKMYDFNNDNREATLLGDQPIYEVELTSFTQRTLPEYRGQTSEGAYSSSSAGNADMLLGKKERQDAYAMPGYLLHTTPGTARWIPYTDDVLNPSNTPACLPPQRNASDIPDEILALSPPSFAEMLKNRDRQNPASDTKLQFFANKNILILGCSHDRNFLERFCEDMGIAFVSVTEDKHGMFLCKIPELNFQVQVWFTKGALPEPESAEPAINFEDRIRDHWLPKAAQEGLSVKPDMIIWVSGTWDVLGLRMKYARDNPDWKEQPISWQELGWHRQRLREMINFIRQQWPDVPTMYRPPPYLYKMQPDPDYEYLKGVKIEDIDIINESIRKFEQSTEAVMRETDMPIFRWAEKFVGNSQYSDTVHLSKDGYAQWLFADMMLYYLHYYTAEV